MTPDYSQQLNAIVQALNRPSTPAWQVAVLSALLGFIGGLLAQPLLLIIQERFSLHRMRSVLYRELADLFSAVDTVMAFRQFSGRDLEEWQTAQLRDQLSFEGENYLRSKPELYMQLSERFAADACYRYFHRILDGMPAYNVNASLARAVFADALHDHSIEPGRLRYFLNEERANHLIRRAREIHEQQLALKARLDGPRNSDDAE
jgi:hypothetical protein